jgi:hypothetical protein
LTSHFDRRPIVIAIAGLNGAGKSISFWTHLLAVTDATRVPVRAHRHQPGRHG